MKTPPPPEKTPTTASKRAIRQKRNLLLTMFDRPTRFQRDLIEMMANAPGPWKFSIERHQK